MLRWSGPELAVPCITSNGKPAVVVLDGRCLTELATFVPSDHSQAWATLDELDCAWLSGSRQLIIWASKARQGWFKHTARVDLSAPQEIAFQQVQAPLCRPQWGFRRMAATCRSGPLALYSTHPSTLRCLAVLPGALPVHRSRGMWHGLTTYSFCPRRQLLALLCTSAEGMLSLVLLDAHHAGAQLWSYALCAASEVSLGEHHVAWSAMGTGLTVSVTAGFLCKWYVSFWAERSRCCPEGCQQCEQSGKCPKYRHEVPRQASDDPGVQQAMGMLIGLLAAGMGMGSIARGFKEREEDAATSG